GYWAAMMLVPVPGHGAGVLTPDGNLAGWIDRTLLGVKHVYGNGPYDPEGLLSTLPAVVTALIGYLAGNYVRRRPADASVARRLCGKQGRKGLAERPAEDGRRRHVVRRGLGVAGARRRVRRVGDRDEAGRRIDGGGRAHGREQVAGLGRRLRTRQMFGQ